MNDEKNATLAQRIDLFDIYLALRFCRIVLTLSKLQVVIMLQCTIFLKCHLVK